MNISKKYQNIRLSVVLLPLIAITTLLILSPVSFFSFFPKDSLISAERDYVFSWPSGYGLKELNSYLTESSNKADFVLIVPATPNPLSSYLFLTSSKNPKIRLLAASIDSEISLNEIKKISNQYPTFFVSSNKLIPKILSPYLKQIKTFEKPGKEDYLGMYSINFESEKN